MSESNPPCPLLARTYNEPVLDIKLVRDEPDFVGQRLALRGGGHDADVHDLRRLIPSSALVARNRPFLSSRNHASRSARSWGWLMLSGQQRSPGAASSSTRIGERSWSERLFSSCSACTPMSTAIPRSRRRSW